ncbi:MAG: endonuclease/exonuclease/phosphatase family protein [Methylobacter sp.]|nr:endonuclease/exonuclease/phosphatase family protein [Methylobacter sp.]
MSENSFRLLTYNLHKGFNVGNRRFVLHQIREALTAADADVMCLQEMQGEHRRHQQKIADWPVLPQLEFLAENTWPFHAYGKNAVYSNGDHGNAILSKHPFEQWENINVSPFTWASRSLLHSVIRLGCGQLPAMANNRDIHIVCIHFGLIGTERRQQISQLSARIDSHVPHDAPLIIAGDFNDWLGQAERLFHDRLGLREIFRETHGRYARSFPAWLPVLPMDRIYYRGLVPLSCERLNHAPWTTLSDHAPLTASFSL